MNLQLKEPKPMPLFGRPDWKSQNSLGLNIVILPEDWQKNNEDLKKQQYNMEKDIMSVLSYLKKQDQEKDNMIEKLKQQLAKTKEKAQEEKEKLEQKYALQVSELEGQFHQKAKEIGMIQTELKTIKQFQKRKIQVEKELDDLKENLRNSEKNYQETLRRLESRFFEEKHRLEQEAEKRIIMLAERAHHEAVVPTTQKNVDIRDLTWEQKEKVLRLLFAKMNGFAARKYSQSSKPPVPDHIIYGSGEMKETGDENNLLDQTFITQQAPVSDSNRMVSPDVIPQGLQDSDIGVPPPPTHPPTHSHLPAFNFPTVGHHGAFIGPRGPILNLCPQ